MCVFVSRDVVLQCACVAQCVLQCVCVHVRVRETSVFVSPLQHYVSTQEHTRRRRLALELFKNCMHVHVHKSSVFVSPLQHYVSTHEHGRVRVGHYNFQKLYACACSCVERVRESTETLRLDSRTRESAGWNL